MNKKDERFDQDGQIMQVTVETPKRVQKRAPLDEEEAKRMAEVCETREQELLRGQD